MQGWVDADAADSEFSQPWALAAKSNTTLYVGEQGDNRIRRIDLSGAAHNVTTLAGNGSAGYHDGIGQAAVFNTIQGMALDTTGTLYVADGGNSVIRKIDPTDPSNAVTSTLAGVKGTTGHVDGPASTAQFFGVWGLAVVGTNLFVAEGGNHDIRRIDLSTSNATVSTIAGTGSSGSSDGPGSVATFNKPRGLVADAAGNYLYVIDAGAHNVRRISLKDGNWTVSTVAGVGAAGYADGPGTSAAFNAPTTGAIAADGALYVTDTGNQKVRRIDLSSTSFTTSTYVGSTQGFQDANGTNARFNGLAGIAAVGNQLYVADPGNFRIRLVQ